MAKSLKNYRKQLKENGVFYTDPKLAEKLKSYFPNDITEIYDPTCGCGNLLSVFPDTCKKFGQELDPDEAEEAQNNLVNADIRIGDTLLADQFKDRKFKYIVANPPFSVKWQPELLENDERFNVAPTIPTASKADFAFLLHIIAKLEDNGIATAINAPGVLSRGNREGKIRKWIVQQNLIDRVIHIPSGFFDDTKISTCLLVIRKNKETTDITFEDWETEETKVVSLQEVEKNDYCLQVNLYISKKIDNKFDNPDYDIKDLTKQIDNGFLKQFRSHLDIKLMLTPKEEINDLLNAVQEIINEYRNKEPEINIYNQL